MSANTGIEWTDATWNPVRGCSRVSEGCRNCYAERVAARFSKPGQPYHGLAKIVAPRDGLDRVGGRRNGWTGEVRLIPEHLADPLRWKRPRRIFVNSMSDLFHEKLSNEAIAAVFGVMAAAPQHTFQVLTKRARRMHDWFDWASNLECDPWTECHAHALGVEAQHTDGGPIHARSDDRHGRPWPLPNVWLGVSVENQEAADERIPELLETPAEVRFLSCEPLLGPLDIAEYLDPAAAPCGETSAIVDWVIAGCESGPVARPCDVSWLRALRDQCDVMRVPYFLKQAMYTFGDEHSGERDAVTGGPDSHDKRSGVIGAPYLDGVQHLEFPR